MNTQTQTLSEPAAKSVSKSCYKCGYIRETSDEKCPECGKNLESMTLIRTTGAMQIVLGGGLLIIMGWLAFWMLGANSTNRFHGGASDVLFIVFVFALVVSISLGTLTAGIWQIIFGKRNKVLMFAMIVLGIVFAAAGFGVILYK